MDRKPFAKHDVHGWHIQQRYQWWYLIAKITSKELVYNMIFYFLQMQLKLCSSETRMRFFFETDFCHLVWSSSFIYLCLCLLSFCIKLTVATRRVSGCICWFTEQHCYIWLTKAFTLYIYNTVRQLVNRITDGYYC